MRNLLLATCLILSSIANAGAVRSIPVQLMSLDNQGRTVFLENALEETGLSIEHTRYTDFESRVVGGDERGSDFEGALFIFSISLLATNRSRSYRCYQRLAVGDFDQELTNPIVCE